MSQHLPLEGVKVVSLCNFVAGPTATRYMSELGADVIKVESVSGDPWRFYGPACNCPATEQENPLFDIYNAHKRDLALNLKDPRGKEILFKLLETADVFVTNTRPQALVKMGIDYNTIKDRFPRLVYAQITGYGQEGPDRDEPGYDGVAFFARSGLLADTAEPSGYPTTPPGCAGDVTSGLSLFGGICAALLGRERTGKGDNVEVSLYGSAIFLCSTLMTVTQPQYNDPYPKARHQLKPLNTFYQCKDGEWLTMSIMEPDRYFKPLCQALEIPDVGDDPRFQGRTAILNNRAELIPILEEAFQKFDSADILARLSDADVVATRMRHFKELSTDPQALANDYVRPFTFESGNTTVLPMIPIKFRSVGKVEFQRGPLLGEHTAQVLGELGYQDADIQTLKTEKVVK